jgi:hypothetical protein
MSFMWYNVIVNFITFFKEPIMAKKAKGRAKPGSTVTRKVSRGPNKGDTVQFKANKSGTQQPGKLKPRRLVKDSGPKNTTTSLSRGKKKAHKKK